MRESPDLLSATFFALADPTRRAILSRLAAGPATVKEISEPFAMSGPAVSKHLRVLEKAGLVAKGREAQWRPRTLEAAPLKAVAEWTGEFARFWDASYSRLDRYLETLQSAAREIPPTDLPRDVSGDVAHRITHVHAQDSSLDGSSDLPLETQGDGYSN